MIDKKGIVFKLPKNLGTIEFSQATLMHFERHKQCYFFSKEAGGQLFARIVGSTIQVVEATGPRKTDKRTMFGYVPDRDAEKAEIKEKYAEGLHFVGDWHTHPQKIPRPSLTDTASMSDMVRNSSYDIDGLLMVIVGQAPFPEGLYVSFYTKDHLDVLEL
jgi:integrative and conjugative element protein (TIGR02256 family)